VAWTVHNAAHGDEDTLRDLRDHGGVRLCIGIMDRHTSEELAPSLELLPALGALHLLFGGADHVPAVPVEEVMMMLALLRTVCTACMCAAAAHADARSLYLFFLQVWERLTNYEHARGHPQHEGFGYTGLELLTTLRAHINLEVREHVEDILRDCLSMGEEERELLRLDAEAASHER